MKNQIVIGCDNAAVALKNVLIQALMDEGCEVEDIGVVAEDDGTAYPIVAGQVCERIIASGYTKEGILVCGTGIGMAITANKYPGIYAAVCHDSFSTERARLSNDANVFCMGARIVGPGLAKMLLKQWLSLQFKGGPSQAKVDKIKQIEGVNFAQREETVG